MAKKEAFDYSIYNRKLDVDEESEDLCAKCMRKLKRFTRTARNARAP